MQKFPNGDGLKKLSMQEYLFEFVNDVLDGKGRGSGDDGSGFWFGS